MKSVATEDELWKWGAVVGDIFDYKDGLPDCSAFGFDSAMVDWPRRVSVKMSCRSVNGWDRDYLHVTASRDTAKDAWKITHVLKRATSRRRRLPAMKETAFYFWWITSEITGKRKKTTWRMTVEVAQQRHPGATPVEGSREVRPVSYTHLTLPTKRIV